MTSNIHTFKNPMFGSLRALTDANSQIWLAAKDVAEVLGYKDASRAITDYVHANDRTTWVIHQSGSSNKSNTTFINESGFYSLVRSSILPQAITFQHWVTSEVFPAIRKEGGYIMVQENDTEKTIMARAVLIAHKVIECQKKENEELALKAEYYDKVLNSTDCLTTTQIAKELGLSAQKLNTFLCDQKIQYQQSGQYMLYAKYASMNLAQNKTAMVMNDKLVEPMPKIYLVWTEEGREFIHRVVKSRHPLFNPRFNSRKNQGYYVPDMFEGMY